LAQAATTHLQSEGLLEHGGRLAVGETQTFIELRGQRQSSGAQLRRGTAQGIRGLSGMPALHPPSATPTAPDRNAKLNALYSWWRNLGLELGDGLALFQSTSAPRTAGRQRYFHNFIDFLREGPTTSAPILLSCFASGLMRIGFGFLSRKGRRLSFPGS
jgi:hypothetical protein